MDYISIGELQDNIVDNFFKEKKHLNTHKDKDRKSRTGQKEGGRHEKTRTQSKVLPESNK